jgi:hypothetical protein
MFVVLAVALVQRVLLHHRLPRIIWPCAVVMLGGAAMVIVPTIGKVGGGWLAGCQQQVHQRSRSAFSGAGMLRACILAVGKLTEPSSSHPLPISARCRAPPRG